MVELAIESDKVREMLLIICPKPDGKLPIANVGGKDQLKKILDPMGFEFLLPSTK